MRLPMISAAIFAALALAACSADGGIIDAGERSPKPSTSASTTPRPEPSRSTVSPSATPSKSLSVSSSPTATDEESPAGGDGPNSTGEGTGAVGPPRVFMSMHGNNVLADKSDTDEQWTYVRENLDGIWGNNADVSSETQIRMWQKLRTRNVISIDTVPAGPEASRTFQRFGERGTPEGQTSGRIKLNREAIALYTHEPSDWVGDSVAEARAVHASPSMKYPYKRVYTGWGMRNFLPADTASKNYAPITDDIDQVLDDGDGAFVECMQTVCTQGGDFTDSFNTAMDRMHRQNKPIIFFWSPSGGISAFKANYTTLLKQRKWRTNDIVMIINYNGKYPVLPQTVNGEPADTVTGMLYWALQQKG
ncbi:MAG: hypothetical protein ACRC0L_02295 [Angustibacter sp.]